MKGRIKDLAFSMDGKNILTLEVYQNCRNIFDKLRETEIDISIKEYKEKRSLNANAYFHVLVNKIAAKQNVSDDEIKAMLNTQYGAILTDEKGGKIGFKLPESVDVNKIYPYTKAFDTRQENGISFNCYICYKRTHELNTKEMSRLIDGTVSEAKELGIETLTPQELEMMIKNWKGKTDNGIEL